MNWPQLILAACVGGVVGMAITYAACDAIYPAAKDEMDALKVENAELREEFIKLVNDSRGEIHVTE